MMIFFRTIIAAITFVTAGGPLLDAGDWPMWRYDSGRGSWTPDSLPDRLELQWVRELPGATPAWPKTQPKLQFDAVAEPVTMGERIFVPSSRNDSVTAYNTRTGEEEWRTYSNGPVRFAPVAADGRVFFVSDDGFLYALKGESGALIWKVKGGPDQNRLLLGNHRLISSWPARGGPVLHQGRIYFGASIWPFMGIFIRAVDPETGAALWTNSGDGTNYIDQPHHMAVAFSGLVPQGHLAASGDHLVVPGGRSVPGVYDTKTGRQLNFAFSEGKKEGSHQVGAIRNLLFAGGRAYTMQEGLAVGGGAPALFNQKEMLASDPAVMLGRSTKVEITREERLDRKGKKVMGFKTKYQELFRKDLDAPISGQWLMGAGKRFYAGGEGWIAAYEQEKPEPVWTAKVKGEVRTMLAGDDRLFAVTGEGRLYCFGRDEVEGGQPREFQPVKKKGEKNPNDDWPGKVAGILKNKGAGEGYAVVLGIASGRLIEELLNQSKLRLLVFDQDLEKVTLFHQKMEAAGLYGERVSVIRGDAVRAGLPPYLCNLIVSETPRNAEIAGKLFPVLRPYGGLLAFVMSEGDRAELSHRDDLPNAGLETAGEWTYLTRQGALPDTDDWTHQYGNAEQTLVSRDKRVKAPFGVLWFGGASHEGILPRHGHGPSPQVAGGRLFIEGADMLRAVDVYTGRVMWEKQIPGFGEYFDRLDHFTGAGETVSNYVSLDDRVFAMNGKVIMELNAADGGVVREYRLSPEKEEGESPRWGSIRVSGNYLIATASPLALESEDKKGSGKLDLGQGSGSRLLVVYDRETGEQLWQRKAQFNFRHNTIIASGEKIFCVDRITSQKEELLARRGLQFEGTPVLYALDAKTGNVIWKRDKDVFGTFLNYSREYDVLLQAGSAARDRARDEVGRKMMVLRGKDGSTVWYDEDIEYNGPCLIWHDKIITNGQGGFSVELLTGKKTGWDYIRTYGCNTAIGSENLLTFRSGAAGFFDLATDSGTGNLGGFKSSCTASLIAADGVLNAPDYTRTCVCSYQNQTSLALVSMPGAEYWTYGARAKEGRWGINFGAPGDRRWNGGTLFVDFPDVGGESPKVDVEIEGDQVHYERVHSSLVKGNSDAPAWLGASVIEGARQMKIDTKGKGNARVRLYFCDLNEKAAEGSRVFDVKLQGEKVINNFDIAKEVGAKTVLMKEFPVKLSKKGKLEIGLKSEKGETALAGVEIVWE